MNSKQTSKGLLKWRNPSVIENMKLLKDAKECFANNDPLGAKISIMEKLGPVLDFSEMEIKSFDELMMLGEEMTQPISEIADEVMTKLAAAFAKKN